MGQSKISYQYRIEIEKKVISSFYRPL